ncbi:hypothetical protein EDB85DRAFT_1894328 [Lactarius pseudohatsudake]|nr:hypothetical protein EDB85DRAFT_1894328 [Lactarius pseudohatsudake]
MSSPARPDKTAEPNSGITHGAIPTHIATEQWAYIGKMPPKPRKLAATSGPGKPAGGATTRSSTATTTPGAASSKTPAPLPTPPSGASVTPEVKPTGMYSFLHKQPTYTPPPVYTPELAATVTPKDLIDAMAVDDDSTPAPPRPPLTGFLHKKLVVTSELASLTAFVSKKPVATSESAPVAADRESEEPTVPVVASDTQQPTPVRDSSSGMVEAAKVRVTMERIRTQVVERNRLIEAIGISSESTLTTIDEFLADITEL